jgi:hypothetical protein
MSWPEIDWNKLIDIQYWFEGIVGSTATTPPVENLSFFYWFFISIFSVIIILSVVGRVVISYLPIEHPLHDKMDTWTNNTAWIGTLGIVWFLSRQVNVGLLGSRFWLLVFAAWFLILGYFVLKYLLTLYPIEKIYYQEKFGKK